MRCSTVRKVRRTCIFPPTKLTNIVRGGDSETYHIVETRWSELCHHCLCERIVRSLKKSKYDIVHPELPYVVKSVDSLYITSSSRGGNEIVSYPNFFVQIPIIPHSGIRIVTTFVTTNLIPINMDAFPRKNKGSDHTIFFVLIFQ